MIEINTFISYRKSDGSDLGIWYYKNMQGDNFVSNSTVYSLSTNMDIGIPARSEWKITIDTNLEKADFLTIVCSPNAVLRNEGDDYLFYEIEWWIKNRKNNPPILIALTEHGVFNVPKIIHNAWKNLQVLTLSKNATELEHTKYLSAEIKVFKESIWRGIVKPSKFDITNTTNSLICIPGIYTWKKDKYGKYIEVNENYARAAGFDSPKSMIGKTDYQMPWRNLAKFFIEGDNKIMNDNEAGRIGVFEKEIMVDKVVDIIVYESPLKDTSNRIIGVVGQFFERADFLTYNASQEFVFDENGLYLNSKFGNAFLDLMEISVFKGLLKNTPKSKLASELNITTQRLKEIILGMQLKFQCTTEKEIIYIAIQEGLPIKLFT